MAFVTGSAHSHAANSKTATIDVKTLPGPERQRGLWSFLTWSFFLATFLAETGILGQQANASTMPESEHDTGHSSGDHADSGVLRPEMLNPSLEPLASHASSQTEQAQNTFHAMPAATAAIPGVLAADTGYPEILADHGSSPAGQSAFSTASPSNEATGNETYSTHDDSSTGGTPNNPIGDHTIPSLVDSIIHPVTGVVAPVVGAVDGALQTVADVVGDLSSTLSHVTSAVDGMLSNTMNTVASLTSNITHVLDSPLATVFDSDGPAHTLLSSLGSDAPIGSTLNGLGLSSSGSLSFAAETPTTMLAHDIGSSGNGYSQFNLALSDPAADSAAPAAVDTGSIGTILASAVGIGSHTDHSDNTSSEHGSDPLSVHLPGTDDLQSHLHSGLFG